MKKKIIIICIIIVVLFAFNIFKNLAMDAMLTIGITKIVGAPVKIGNFSLGIFKQSVQIKDLTVYNPVGFPKGVLLSIPEISVNYDLAALLKRKVYLKKMVIDLDEIGIIKNAQDRLNVDSLKVIQQAPAPKVKEKKPGVQMAIQIDEFILSVGRLVYKDLDLNGRLYVEVHKLGIKDKIYRNITSPQQLTILILTEPMKKAGIEGAKVYGVAALLGAGFLPAGIAAMLFKEDSSQANFRVSYDKAFDAAIEVMLQAGTIITKDKNAGIIKGKVRDINITVEIVKEIDREVKITVSGKKFMMPKPQVAGGVLYQIVEILK